MGIMIYILFEYIAMIREGDGNLDFISRFERFTHKETSGYSGTDVQSISGVHEVSPLFVGDSRTVGMAMALEKSHGFIDHESKSGSGFSYFKTLDNRIRKSGADCLVIGFGVNDLNNLDKYINYANILGEDLSIPVFFLTVNPVDEAKAGRNGYHIKESDIDRFNTGLKEGASFYTVIDTNDYLISEGFETMDGLHYRDETYESIYNFIIEYLSESELLQ